MTKRVTQITVFISCPSDVDAEKKIVRDVCDSLTKVLNKPMGIVIKPIDWEKDVVPLISGQGAQDVIDAQTEDYDVYVGILWKRFGDKQPNGLTPTEGEFQKALQRMQQTGRPVITFYFKLDESPPVGSYEKKPYREVQEFKERIKHLGLYDKFKWQDDFTEKGEFQTKVYESILYIVYNFSLLTSGRVKISKIQYAAVPNYLIRKVYLVKDYDSASKLLLRRELARDILKVIEQEKRIVLLSDAGVGKTTELQRIAHYFSKDEDNLYPFFVSLNKYVQSLTELLPPNWKEIPESRLLLVLDGLDEIESKNRFDAIRQIESFADQCPSSRIVISCRTNFYNTETEQISGTLGKFSSYILLPLDTKEIEDFINKSLNKWAAEFEKTVVKNQLQELLKIPFYLIHLVELFRTSHALPQSKADIFDQLLNARIQLDVSHYRTTIELDEKRNTVIDTLERLALGMEVLGRNYVTSDEFWKLISDEGLRTLIKYCTVWRKNEGKAATWEFEHNNFQEYLAARALSRQTIATMKSFISFKPEHTKVIPSWLNTVSFLLNMSNNQDLLTWILDNEPELAVKFEPDKIDGITRIRIFKEIFNRYKERQIWIDTDKFRYSELAHFGQSNEIVDYLLSELESPAHYTTVSNAIELLGHLQICHNQRKRTIQLLVKCALDDGSGEIVQNHALLALASLKLNSQEGINEILPILRLSTNSRVRFGLYYFLYTSPYLDENIDVFLEGIEYVRSRRLFDGGEIRFGDEHWHLTKGIEKVKSPDALLKILAYFKDNPRDLDNVYFEKSIAIIAENCADAYSKEPLLLDSVIELFTILVNQHLDEAAKQFSSFFDKSHTRLQAFQRLFEGGDNNNDRMYILAALANWKCVEFFIQQYEKHNVTDSDVWKFQHYLGFKDDELYLSFYETINRKSNNRFVLPPPRDYEKERKQRKQRDIELLFDKHAFLQEIKLIFDTERKNTFTSRELLDVETQRWDNPYFSDLAIHILREIAGNKTASFKTVNEVVDNWDWDSFCIANVFESLSHDEDITLSEEQKNWIANWCYSNLDKINFKTALVIKPKGHQTSRLAVYLWYFLRRLDLRYPRNVLLDMISFDWVQGTQMYGIEYLEDRLDKIDMTTRVLGNLQEGIQSNDVLKNHIDYCRRNGILEVLPFVLTEIANKNRNDEVRRISLETFCEMSETLSDLENVLPEIADEFKWSVVRELVKRNNPGAHTFLQKTLTKGKGQDKIKAAEYLIELQHLEGLKYYVEWVRTHKRLPERPSPLPLLRILESVPLLIKLLKMSYRPDFTQDVFHTLDRIVLDALTTIALESDIHYIKVKEAVEEFVRKYANTIENVNFLNVFLEKLEQKYYANKSQKIDIDDAIAKLKEIYSSS